RDRYQENCGKQRLHPELLFRSSRAFSIGRASTALLPTSTIGRCKRFGFLTIIEITLSSDVWWVIPSSLNADSPFRNTSNGLRPAFLSSLRSLSSVNGTLK